MTTMMTPRTMLVRLMVPLLLLVVPAPRTQQRPILRKIKTKRNKRKGATIMKSKRKLTSTTEGATTKTKVLEIWVIVVVVVVQAIALVVADVMVEVVSEVGICRQAKEKNDEKGQRGEQSHRLRPKWLHRRRHRRLYCIWSW